MKAGRPNLFPRILVLLIIIVAAVLLLRPNRGAKLVAETRQTLRQQGFKTDLADFDFSTSAEPLDREAALQALGRVSIVPLGISPNLMEPVGGNSAVVVWKRNSLVSQTPRLSSLAGQLSWDEFRHQLDEHKAAIDAACKAILARPVRFSVIPGAGNAMRLPHLVLLRGLTDALCNRAVVELHDGNKDAAWTNLMAATRLVTAWEPEPVEISHLIRSELAKQVFNATWQALQADGWSDAHLVSLQQEWEHVNFFTNLSEVAAFKRASDADAAVRDRDMILKTRSSMFQFAIQLVRIPKYFSTRVHDRWSKSDYLRHGWYEDQKDLMLYNRDWEVQLRNAVQSPTWAQMRQLPGVTNQVLFQSKFLRSRVQRSLNLRQISLTISRRGGGLLGRTAEAEAGRGILLTALALERYRGKHGSYPSTLAPLAPDFLKTVPVDFMDGQPLRYRLGNDGHFLLYSVGPGLRGRRRANRVADRAESGRFSHHGF